MRVLSVGSLYPPHDRGGGAELVWHSAVASLRAHGHEVRVLTTDHRRPGRAEADEPDTARELRWYWSEHAFPKRGLREVVAIERHNTRVMHRHLDDLGPDVVSWFPMGGMSLSLLETVRRRSVPAVAFVHDDWLLYGPVVDAWHARWRHRLRPSAAAERLLAVPAGVDFGAAAHYAFVSATTRERAQRDGLELPRASVAHAGIDAVFAGPPQPEREWEWRLLYVGRIDRRKGVVTAVRALADLPGQATLTLLGEGPDEDVEAVRAEARLAGVLDRVDLAGSRPREALPAAYGAADVVIFPVEWEEPWGLVPLEAMACGRPVVATGRGGSSEYLRDGGNALLFDAGDHAALAERVRRLAGDPALRRRLRAAGLDTAGRHPEQGFNDRVEALLLEATTA